MANDLNLFQCIGRLGKDVEVRYAASGSAIASFSVALGEKYKSKSGEQVEKTEWVNITAFGKLAEICEKYLVKGSQVYISGRMQTDKYTDKQGVEKYSTKIIANNLQMLGKAGQSNDASKAATPATPLNDDLPPIDEESDIPF